MWPPCSIRTKILTSANKRSCTSVYNSRSNLVFQVRKLHRTTFIFRTPYLHFRAIFSFYPTLDYKIKTRANFENSNGKSLDLNVHLIT